MNFNESTLIEFAKTVEMSSTKVLEGLHTSARGGQGIEYHSTLPYAEGEDAKNLNWRRLAATGHYFVNRFERDEKTGWSLLLDVSASMHYDTKLDWAKLWAGSLIFLAERWGDSWALLPDTQFSLEQAYRILTSDSPGLDLGGSSLPELPTSRHDRLMVFSDFFWSDQFWNSSIELWQEQFSHVYLMQIASKREVAFDFDGVIEFQDLESVDKMTLDTSRTKELYLRAFKEHSFKLESLQSEKLKHRLLISDEKLEHQLLNFFEEL